MSEKYDQDVFISYRRESDFTTAKLIYDQLESKGIDCFLDVHESRPGKFDNRIKETIKHSSNFVLVISKHSFDRCINEDDWLRTEIKTAFDAGKVIIPVFIDSYEWPKEWDERIPDFIKKLPDYDGVPLNPSYFESSIEVLINKFLKGIDDINHNQIRNNLPMYDYFIENKKNISEIKEINMYFFTGSRWFLQHKYNELFIEFLQKGIKVKVIINLPEVAESLGKHMRKEFMIYQSFEDGMELWKRYDELFDNLEVRVCNIPFLHSYESFIYNNYKKDSIRINDYAYQVTDLDKISSVVLSYYSPLFKTYQKEFEYLWDHSKDIKNFS